MKKTLAVMAAVLLLSGALAGCQGGSDVASGTDLSTETLPASGTDLETEETSARTPVSVEDAVALIEEQTTFAEDLTELKSSRIASQFGLDESKIKTAVCKVAASGACPDVILAIEANSEEDAEALYDTLAAYQKNESERWGTYNAEQQPKMESAVLDTAGSFVIFSVSEDNSLIGTTIYSYLRY